MMLHELLATRDPEWTMTEAEGRILAQRFANYARHWSVFKDLDPKTRDFRALLSCIAIMEGPRLYRITTRRSAAKRAARDMAAQAAASPGGTIIDLDNLRR